MKTVTEYRGVVFYLTEDAADDLEPDQFIHYGYVNPANPNPKRGVPYFAHDLLGGSDYSGGPHTVSNHRVFLERHGDKPGVHEVFGGHGTYGVAVRVDALDDEMREDFDSLEEYPLLDACDHSYVEVDAQEEAWKKWVCSDLRSQLTERFPDLEDTIDGLSEGGMYEIFRCLCNDTNTYWVNEEGNNAYIDVKQLVEGASIATRNYIVSLSTEEK